MIINEYIVLISTRTFPDQGGVAINVFLQAKEFSSSIKTIILTSKIKNMEYKKRVRINKNLEIIRLPFTPPGFNAPFIKLAIYFILFYFFGLIELIKLKKRKNIKLIHAHNPPPTGLIAYTLKKIFKIPYFFTLHGLDYPNQLIMNFDVNLIMKNASKSFAISQKFIDLLVKRYKLKNIYWIPNGIYINDYFSINNTDEKFKLIRQLNLQSILNKDDFIIIYIGYMSHFETKVMGMIDFIYAFSNFISKLQSNEEKNKIKLLFIGDGDYFNFLKKKIIQLGLTNNIYLLGYRNDVNKILALSDLLGLTSSLEGFPTVILEAMASRVPCLATDTGDIKRIINDCGFIVKVGDIEEIEHYINYYYNLPKVKRNILAEKSYERIKNNFDIKIVIKKIYQLYDLHFWNYDSIS